jgi:cytochrome c556
MDGIVDPAADELWASVETTVTKDGVEDKQPHTPEEWAEVRRKAITLIEASTLLSIPGRKAAAKPFPAEAEGALDSAQIQRRLDADHAAFAGFAGSLRVAAQKALAAIDARDPAALVEAGGVMDGVCEGCHMTFWYPNQVIPPIK